MPYDTPAARAATGWSSTCAACWTDSRTGGSPTTGRRRRTTTGCRTRSPTRSHTSTPRFFRSGKDGRTQGGLFGLDGVHPSTVGYGLIAKEVLDILGSVGVTTKPVDFAALARQGHAERPARTHVGRMGPHNTVPDPPGHPPPLVS